MTIEELIEEYKEMAHICHNVDYSNRASVRNNNKAVTRMYQIIDTIKSEYKQPGVCEFAKLVSYRINRTDIWASVQMLEKMDIDDITETLALSIIKEEAKQSLGMQYWLKQYHAKKKGPA